MKNLMKELQCLETLGTEFYLALLDQDGRGSDLYSHHAIPLAEKIEGCNMTLAEEISSAKKFDKCIS